MAQFKFGKPISSTPFIFAHPSLAAHYLLEGRTLVCFIRHGQTDWNTIRRLQGQENIPLNEVGRAQAQNVSVLVEKIRRKGVTFGAVYTSPLSRASETADSIAQSLGLGKAVVLDSLIERDYGALSGLTLDERRRLFPGGEKQAGNVESVPAAASRMLSAVDDMLEHAREHCSEKHTVIGVTHSGLINACFSRLTSGEIGTGKTVSGNCSLSCIAAGIGEAIPLAYNLQNDHAVDYLTKILRSGAEI